MTRKSNHGKFLSFFLIINSFFAIIICSSLVSGQVSENENTEIPFPSYSIEKYNSLNSGTNGMPHFNKAYWIHITHGNLHYMLQADRFIDNSVRYQQNIHIQINNTDFMAQFGINELKMEFNDFSEIISLSNCSDFQYEASQFSRIDGKPRINFNLTYQNVRIQTYGNGDSSLNFKICHYFTFGFNESRMKIETWTDLRNAKFYNQSTHTEITTATPMNLSLSYSMGLFNNTGPQGPHIPILPVNLENEQLIYDVPYKNGQNLSISKFDMNNTFFIFNDSGKQEAIAKSWISKNGDNYFATHQFDNLLYNQSKIIYSDPLLIFGHDVVNGNADGWSLFNLENIPYVVLISIVSVWGIKTIKKRKKIQNLK